MADEATEAVAGFFHMVRERTRPDVGAARVARAILERSIRDRQERADMIARLNEQGEGVPWE